MFLLLLLRILWQCALDVGRRSQTVCWRQWANVSTLTVFAAAPVPAYWRGRLSLLMTTTTPTVFRITTGNYLLLIPYGLTKQYINKAMSFWCSFCYQTYIVGRGLGQNVFLSRSLNFTYILSRKKKVKLPKYVCFLRQIIFSSVVLDTFQPIRITYKSTVARELQQQQVVSSSTTLTQKLG